MHSAGGKYPKWRVRPRLYFKMTIGKSWKRICLACTTKRARRCFIHKDSILHSNTTVSRIRLLIGRAPSIIGWSILSIRITSAEGLLPHHKTGMSMVYWLPCLISVNKRIRTLNYIIKLNMIPTMPRFSRNIFFYHLPCKSSHYTDTTATQ